MKTIRRPLVLSLVTSTMTLALWAALGLGANFGMHPVFAVAGLLWLFTVGLPTSLGVALAATHPRLYADTAVLGSQFRWRCIPEIVRTPSVLPRMIHASGWPFPANALAFWNRLHPFALVGLTAEKNLFLRDLQLKQALGMAPESFHRMCGLLTGEAAFETKRLPGDTSRIP